MTPTELEDAEWLRALLWKLAGLALGVGLVAGVVYGVAIMWIEN